MSAKQGVPKQDVPKSVWKHEEKKCYFVVHNVILFSKIHKRQAKASPTCHVVGKEMLEPKNHRYCRNGQNDELLVAVGAPKLKHLVYGINFLETPLCILSLSMDG